MYIKVDNISLTVAGVCINLVQKSFSHLNFYKNGNTITVLQVKKSNKIAVNLATIFKISITVTSIKSTFLKHLKLQNDEITIH